MAQSKILVNGTIGSNDNLPINTLVQLNNQNVGGESTYNWVILDQPPGSPDSLSSLVIQNPTFTPRKEGTYLIQLTVNLGLPTEVSDSVICAIREVKTLQRVPAAGETTQDNQAEGWAVAVNDYLRAMDTQLADPGIIVGVDTAGGLVAGDIVNASSSPTIKTGLPGQEVVPGFTIASASSASTFSGMVAIVVSDVAGNAGPFAAGDIIRVRYIGRYPAAPLSGSTLGQIVYLSNSGTLSLTQGTNRRQVGTVMAAYSTTADVWFDGVGGFEITPINAPYLINGPDAALTGATDVTHLSAFLNFAQNTGEGAIDILHLNALAGATGIPLRVYTGGTEVARIDAAGRLGVLSLGYVSAAGSISSDSTINFDVTGSDTLAINLIAGAIGMGSERLQWTNIYEGQASIDAFGYGTEPALQIWNEGVGADSPTTTFYIMPPLGTSGTQLTVLGNTQAAAGMMFQTLRDNTTGVNGAFIFQNYNTSLQMQEQLAIFETYLTSYGSVEGVFVIAGDGQLNLGGGTGYYWHREALNPTPLLGGSQVLFTDNSEITLPAWFPFEVFQLQIASATKRVDYIPAISFSAAYTASSIQNFPEVLYLPVDTTDAWFDSGSTTLTATITLIYNSHVGTGVAMRAAVTPLALNTSGNPTAIAAPPQTFNITGFKDCGAYVTGTNGSDGNEVHRVTATMAITGVSPGQHLAIALQRTDTNSGLVYLFGAELSFKKTLNAS